MNKKIVFAITIAGLLLITLNIVLYRSSTTFNNHIESNNTTTENISILSNFRNNIVEMSNMHKLWISTGKENYKSDFETCLQKSYDYLDDLEEGGYITPENKKEVIKTMEEYKHVSDNIENVEPIGKDLENQIIQNNQIQIQILEETTQSVVDVNESLVNNNQKLMEITQNKDNIAKTISGIVPAIMGIPIYLLKKEFKNGHIDANKIIDCIIDEDNDEDEGENDSKEAKQSKVENTFIKDVDINTIESIDILCNYKVLLSSANLIYNENLRLKNKITGIDDTLSRIKFLIKSIELKMYYSSEYSNSQRIMDLE